MGREASGGDGPVVLVHGLGGSARWWRRVLPALEPRFDVHLVDVPRFTRAAPPEEAAAWLAGWAEERGLERLRVVGHSLGGLIATQLAVRRPDLVAGLALVAPAGIPVGRPLPLWAVPALRSAAGHRAVVLADALRAGPLSLLRGAGYALTADVTAEAGRVRAPVLVVWGARDPLLPARLADAWAASLPSAELLVLPGAGHVPMFDDSDALAAALVRFLGE